MTEELIRFCDSNGKDLGWKIIGWDLILQPKPLTTQDITAAAQEAEPPSRVRRGEEPPSYKRGRLVFHGIQVVIECTRWVRNGMNLTCCTSF